MGFAVSGSFGDLAGLPVRLGEPVNTAAGLQDGRRPTAGRRVISTGFGITVIAVGAISRFALAGGSPHGLNVHVVGVVLILVGMLSLLLSLLVRAGPRRTRSLVRQGRGGYYDLPGPNARLQRTRQAAADDIAQVRGDDRFYAPDAPGREEDDLQTWLGSAPSHESQKTRKVKTLLGTLAAAPARCPRTQWQDRGFYMCARAGAGKTLLLKHHTAPPSRLAAPAVLLGIAGGRRIPACPRARRGASHGCHRLLGKPQRPVRDERALSPRLLDRRPAAAANLMPARVLVPQARVASASRS
jgi:hypothetical protein